MGDMHSKKENEDEISVFWKASYWSRTQICFMNSLNKYCGQCPETMSAKCLKKKREQWLDDSTGKGVVNYKGIQTINFCRKQNVPYEYTENLDDDVCGRAEEGEKGFTLFLHGRCRYSKHTANYDKTWTTI